MENFNLGIFLHAYQPFWQSKEVLDKIVRECYRPVFKFLREWNGGFAFTLNINYSLLELLKKFGHDDVLEDIRYCVSNYIVELVYSTYCHPIAPLIPQEFFGLQINEDTKSKKAFGLEANCGGFFFPEMAFNKECLDYLKEEKSFINWTIVQDIAVLPGQVPFDRIISYKDFPIFLRSSYWSKYVWDNHLSFDEFAGKLNYELPNWTGRKRSYLIIGMDMETFGHHVPGLIENFLIPLIKNWGSNGIISPFEGLRKKFPLREIGVLRPCSWSTSHDDLWVNKPFPLWDDRDNPHHRSLWDLVNMATQCFVRERHSKEDLHEFFKTQCSCFWWWIGRGHWAPDLMIMGARDAFKLIHRYGNADEVEVAKKLLNQLEMLCR